MGMYGAPREIRTPGLLVRSQTLYPTELGAHRMRVCMPSAMQQFLTYQEARFGANISSGRVLVFFGCRRWSGSKGRDFLGNRKPSTAQ